MFMCVCVQTCNPFCKHTSVCLPAGLWTALKTAREQRVCRLSPFPPAWVVLSALQPVPPPLPQVLSSHNTLSWLKCLSFVFPQWLWGGWKKKFFFFLLCLQYLKGFIICSFVTDMMQISTTELAAKAEETREQLRHLDQQVGCGVCAYTACVYFYWTHLPLKAKKIQLLLLYIVINAINTEMEIKVKDMVQGED